MAEPFLAEIRMFAGNFAPVGWAFCNGQILAISTNTALFSLVGTFYGGDGVRTFALPNLQARFPIHQGSSSQLSLAMGQTGGSATTQLTTQNLPSHSHGVNANSAKGNQPGPIGHYPAADAAGVTAEYSAAQNGLMNPNMIAATGDGQPASTMPPYLAISFIIALEGIYPARN